MKKISQGKYEVYTTKADAIHKFMQLQGYCRETLSSESAIHFSCTKKGDISISDPPHRRKLFNSTTLYAKIVEQENKTYITFYTHFSKLKYVFNLIHITLSVIAAVFSVIMDSTVSPVISIFCLIAIVALLFVFAKEKENAAKDSEILIKELEERVNAVNRWDG